MLSIFILIRGTSKLFVTFVKGFLEDKKPSCNRIASLELCWIFNTWALPETCCNKAIVSDGAMSATKELELTVKPFLSSPHTLGTMWQYAVLFNLLAGQQAENGISLTAGSSRICCCGKKKKSGLLVFLGCKKLTYVLLVCVTWGACPLWLAALRSREMLFWDTSHKENLVRLAAHHSMEQTRMLRHGCRMHSWHGGDSCRIPLSMPEYQSTKCHHHPSTRKWHPEALLQSVGKLRQGWPVLGLESLSHLLWQFHLCSF